MSDKIIDFNKGKEKHKNDLLSKIDPNAVVDTESILQALSALVVIIQEKQKKVNVNTKYTRKQLKQLMDYADELTKTLDEYLNNI